MGLERKVKVVFIVYHCTLSKTYNLKECILKNDNNGYIVYRNKLLYFKLY